MGIWLAVAVAAKGTLVADVVAADTVAGVAPCTMGTTLAAGVMHNIEPAHHALQQEGGFEKGKELKHPITRVIRKFV